MKEMEAIEKIRETECTEMERERKQKGRQRCGAR